MEPPSGSLSIAYTLLVQVSFLPVTAESVAFLFIFFFLVICSSIISGSEVAFFSIKGSQLEQVKQSNPRYGHLIGDLLGKPRLLLATILVSNTMINISIIILATMLSSLLIDFGDNTILNFIVDVVTVTFILVLLGEVVPKVYATQANIVFASAVAYPMLFMTKMFYPLTWFMVKYSAILEKRINKRSHDVSLFELRKAIEITSDEQTDKEENKLLRGIVNFGNIAVTQIMTARTDIVAYDINTSFAELLEKINDHRYSRVPICKDGFDDIIGVLYIKDLIPHLNKENFTWAELLRKPYFVPETKMIDDLLKEFQKKKVHLAIVVDEYGGTAGLVTLEDILEEIVGEINDEFDEEEVYYSKVDDHNYVFDAKTSIPDFLRVIGLNEEEFEEVRGDADSLGGLIIELTGKMPVIGEVIDYKNYRFTIESVDRRRIKRVKVSILNVQEENPEVSK